MTAKQKLINKLVEDEPLTMNQIERLSPHSLTAVIPYDQKHCKRYGLILYSTYQRDGAEEEAENLNHALGASGCLTIKQQFSGKQDLLNGIEGAIRNINDCSLLIVCLMSHGGRGAISGDGGEQIAIDPILQKLDHHLPKFTPLVSSSSLNHSGAVCSIICCLGGEQYWK